MQRDTRIWHSLLVNATIWASWLNNCQAVGVQAAILIQRPAWWERTTSELQLTLPIPSPILSEQNPLA